jgi:rhomboid-like protein
MASMLVSHMWTNLVRLPRLLRMLANPARLSSAQALAAHQAILPGLGASGAIYATVVIAALYQPDARIAIIFLPFFSFPIGLGVTGLCLVDLIGVIRGWK